MNFRILCHVVLLLMLTSVPATLFAGGLSEAQVTATLTALQELEATFGQRGSQQGPQADLQAFTNSQADVDKAMAILRSNGFSSVEEWTSVTQRVVNAYMAVKFATEQPDASAEMARARAEIEASDMSPEQKRQVLAMMEQSMAAMRQMTDAPPEDVATVRGMLPELDAYFVER